MVSIGTAVPAVSCDAYQPDGRIEAISLANYRGRWLVLFFWPLDFTFACATEIRAYSDLSQDFDISGAVVLGASVNSVHAHRAGVRQGLGAVRLPMLGDVSHSLAQHFGVLADSGAAIRATFIIKGRVASVAENDLNVGRSARETLRLLHTQQSSKIAACEGQSGTAPVAD
ncbi:MAG: redoxin domain-containing protein [Thiobacillus sp.]